MKIAVSQIKVVPGRPDINTATILDSIQKCKNRSVDVVIFSEMVVPGYLLGDEWENKSFINDLLNYNEKIKEASDGVVVIWGNVQVDKTKKGEDGRWRKYNAVYIAKDKKWLSNDVFEGYSIKSLMPKYREFDDERHFYSLQKFATEKNKRLEQVLQPFEVEVRGEKVKLGLMLCEDMWSDDYSVNPSEILVNNGAELLVNISCSPWTAKKNEKRNRVVKGIVEKLKVPFLYCNNIGIQNNGKNIFLFDGNSCVYDRDGNIVSTAQDYKEELIEVETKNLENTELTQKNINEVDKTGLNDLYKGLLYGIGSFFESLPSKKVVIGLSGGVDSAVVASLLVDALGKENVTGVNMPSVFNSDLTKNAAKKLAENLEIEYLVAPIQNSVNLTIEELRLLGIEPSNVMIENIQARDRSSRVLAAIAASKGGVFVNNGNKTETALGYCTLYGDVDGVFAPIADMYKGQVYEMAKLINSNAKREIIPVEILEVVPSAELSANQDVTKGKGDPINYPYHDKLIRAFVEWRWDIAEVLEKYDNNTMVKEFELEGEMDNYFSSREDFIFDLEEKWRLYKINVFKRIQAPPIIAVSKRAFGFDLRESQNGVYFSKEFLARKNPLS